MQAFAGATNVYSGRVGQATNLKLKTTIPVVFFCPKLPNGINKLA